MSSDNYELIFRQYTIENIEEKEYLDDVKGIEIHIYHKWGYHVFLFLYEDELKLLLSLLRCTKEELTLKKVIGVELFGENIAIGYDDKYFLFRDISTNRNNSSKLLSLDELCASLDIFNYTALDDNDKVVDMRTLIMQCVSGIVPEVGNVSNSVRILHR